MLYKKRESNIELLRVIAMFAVIMFHIQSHGIAEQLADANLIEKFDNGFFGEPIFYKKLLVLEIVAPLGICANYIFVLISGYFLNGEACGSKVYKMVKKLLGQAGYAAILLSFISLVYYKINRGKGVFVNMLNTQYFNNGWWFIGWYISIATISLLFINRFHMQGCDEKLFIVVLIALSSNVWSGGVMDSLADGLRTLIAGVAMFYTGGHIRKSHVFDKIPTVCFWIGIVFIYGVCFLNYYNNTKNNAQKFILNQTTGIFLQRVTAYKRYDIIPMILAILFFELFRRLKIANISMINKAGAATFMVYLVHENSFVLSIYQNYDWIYLLNSSLFLYLFTMLAVAIAIFFVGIICHKFYCFICLYFGKKINNMSRG